MTVAIVIPAHDEASTIAETVRSCAAQTHPVDQIIVVADNCADATAERAFDAGAVVLEGNGGSKAAAQNLALPKISSDVVLAIDGDATLSSTSVAAMMRTMRAGHAGTCPAALPCDTATAYSQYRTIYHAVSNGWMRRAQDLLGRQLVLSGMANCHRTDVLREVGGFPERTITEDFDLTWQLHRRGRAVAFTPEARVYTREPTSLRELLDQMHRWTSGFAQTVVAYRTPFLDVASFVVVGSQVVDAVVGGVAVWTFLPFLLRHGPAGLWRWWSPLWLVVVVVSIGVAVDELGVRTTLKCLPGWFALQTLTGPMGSWWLFREAVLGRHLTSWTGRHGCRANITPMTRRRKAALSASAVVAGAAAFAVCRRSSRGKRATALLRQVGRQLIGGFR